MSDTKVITMAVCFVVIVSLIGIYTGISNMISAKENVAMASAGLQQCMAKGGHYGQVIWKRECDE